MFTGSTAAGKAIIKSSSDTVKRLYVHEDIYDAVR